MSEIKPKFGTIEYARQRLGKRVEHLTDRQINDILNMINLICNKAIDGDVGTNSNYEN